MGMDLSGIRARLEAAAEQMREGAADGLEEWAEYVLQESSQLVPIEEGTLSNSGQTEVDRANLKAAVGYGSGGARDYAVVQHEDLSLRHDSGRSGKYLERPAVQSRAVGEQIIGDAIKRRLG